MAVPDPAPCGLDAAILRGEARAADYTAADLAELRALATRWHELVGWRSGTAETLRALQRISPAGVLRELAEFRALVKQAEARA